MTIDFQQLSHAGIQNLVPYKPGKSIEELAKEKGITDIIKLASNENPHGCSPLALKALQAMPSQLIATYPSPINHPLIPKLAAKHAVNADNIFVSNGSDYLFGILMTSFALHTDKHILIHDYAFSTFAIQAHTLKIPVKSVPIAADWQVDIQAVIEACNDNTSIIFIANPNNPTGQLIAQEKIRQLLEAIPSKTILVLDEAYFEFAAAGYSCNSIDWLNAYPNLVVTRTFSKIYGLAGLRLGYAISNPEIIAIMRRVQLPFSVNQAALTCADAALDDGDFIRLSLQTNEAGMQQISAGLSKLNLSYIPSVCNFITFDCKEDGIRLYNYLLDRGIIVRPLHPYRMDNFIRVSIGTKEQNTRFLNALDGFYQ